MKKMFLWRLFKDGINELGYIISLKYILLSVIAMIGFIILTSLIYKVHMICQIILVILGLLILPTIIRSRFIYKYEEKRFYDISSYMEQISSSFWKQSKIISALKDTNLISDGKLKSLTDEAIEYIEKGVSVQKDIYTEALNIIEQKYSCKRLNSLHKFLVKVEVFGGEYYNSLNILLRDLHSWMERTIVFQKNKKMLRVNYAAVLILSLLSCTLATFLSYLSITQNNFLSSYLDITGSSIYQIMTTVFISSCIISFALIHKRLTGSWLDYIKNDKLILDDYQTVLSYSYKKTMIKRIPVVTIMILISLVIYIFKMYNYILIPLFIGVIYFIYPVFKYRGAKSRTIDEIKISFPEWLREITLYSQYQTIQMAFQNSILSSPTVLKNPIIKLVYEIEQSPSSIKPYDDFLSEFDIQEIKSAMRILYSISELSHKKSREMLNVLIERNYVMIDKAENTYYKNKFIVLKQLLYLPMIFSMCKIIVDLFLFANSFFNGFSELNNYIQ